MSFCHVSYCKLVGYRFVTGIIDKALVHDSIGGSGFWDAVAVDVADVVDVVVDVVDVVVVVMVVVNAVGVAVVVVVVVVISGGGGKQSLYSDMKVLAQ